MMTLSKKTKIICFAAAAVVLIAAGLFFFLLNNNDTPTEKAAKEAAQYVACNSQITFGNEWTAITLARGGYKCTNNWLDEYYSVFLTEIKNTKDILSENAYTVYSRCILTCWARDIEPENVCRYDLAAPLSDTETVLARGLNGGIFALIALDVSGGNNELINEYIDIILSKQQESGAFGLNPNVPDVDITAMALQALAPHTERQDVQAAVYKALASLSASQSETDEFSSMGVANSQSLSQVILALDALNIPLDDPRFVKNGNTPLSVLMSYKRSDGGFARQLSGQESMLSATLQVLQALTAINDSKPFYTK